MKIIFPLLFFIFLNLLSYAQENKNLYSISRNTFFVEALGNGFLGSINYDRILSYSNKFKVSGRIGGFYLPEKSKPFIADPGFWSALFEINFMWGKDAGFELGTGLSEIHGLESGGGKDDPPSSTLYLPLRIGLRGQNSDGGFFFRVAIIPMIAIYDFHYSDVGTLPMFGGMCFGYTLKKKSNKKE